MLIVSRDPRWFMVIVAVVIIGREIAVSALREWMAEIGARGRIKVSVWGKYKTIMQIVGLSFLLFRQNLFDLPIYKMGLVLTGIAVGADALVHVSVHAPRVAGAARQRGALRAASDRSRGGDLRPSSRI